MSFSERGAGQDVQFHETSLLIQDLSKISAAVAPESSMTALQELGMKVSPHTQLKPFERLVQGDAVSRQEFAGDEPGHGTLDEGERGSPYALAN
jgi:hypothetical protein